MLEHEKLNKLQQKLASLRNRLLKQEPKDFSSITSQATADFYHLHELRDYEDFVSPDYLQSVRDLIELTGMVSVLDETSDEIKDLQAKEVVKQVTDLTKELLISTKAKLLEAARVKADEGSRLFAEIKTKQEAAQLAVNELDRATKKTELLIDKYEALLKRSISLPGNDLKQAEERAAQINAHALQIVVEIDSIKMLLSTSVKKALAFEGMLRELDKSYQGAYYDELLQQYKMVQKKYISAVSKRKETKNKFESTYMVQLKAEFDAALAEAREAQFFSMEAQQSVDKLELFSVLEQLENYYRQVESDYSSQKNLIKQFLSLKEEMLLLYEQISENNLLTCLAIGDQKIKQAMALSDKISTVRSHTVVRLSMLAEEIKVLQPKFGVVREFTIFQAKYDALRTEIQVRKNNEVEVITELSMKQKFLSNKVCEKLLEYFSKVLSDENVQHFWCKQVSFFGRLNAYKDGARVKIEVEGKEEYCAVPRGIYYARTVLDQWKNRAEHPVEIKEILQEIIMGFQRRVTLPNMTREKATDEFYRQMMASFLNEQGEFCITRTGLDALKMKLKTPLFEGLQIDLTEQER